MSKSTLKQSTSKSTSNDPVAELIVVAGQLPDTQLAKSERRSRTAARVRATPNFMTLMLALARKENGVVAGVALPPDELSAKLDRAKLLYAGATACRSGWSRLSNEALVTESDVAQLALSAFESLVAQAKSPQGAALRTTVRELRAALKVRRAPKKQPVAPAAVAPSANAVPPKA